MFLLDRIGFLALVGLFTQTAMTWLFVGLFAMLARNGDRPRHLRTWSWAFAALAVGLTAMCVRFFRAHDDFGVYDRQLWSDGQPLVIAIYSVYVGCKVLFAQMLVRGTAGLCDRPVPRAVRVLDPLLLLAVAALPWIVHEVTWLLAVQAPVMIGYCLYAFAMLRSTDRPAPLGRRMVRIAMLATACIWTVHGAAAIASQLWPLQVFSVWLAMNSHVDAGLELLLGAGLIIALLQAAHERLHQSLQEQARLRTEAERDEKLRALGVLVSGVAHELNNPLTAILGFAHELDESGRQGTAARIVREQAERCRGIVRSLSALAGECAHPREVVDCRALGERVARGFAPQLQAAGVALQLELVAVPPIVADAMAIEQVLANLVANAIQAGPRGSSVRLQVHADAASVVFDVDDQGPGVPHELRTRLFEPFFTTKAPGKGTGLGLAVAFAIVRAHAGQLVVDTPPSGKGARFRVRLPIAAPAQIGEATPRATTAPRVLRRRLLVVDDEPTIRAVLQRRGEQLGWDVATAESAEAALQWLEHQQADVVLCDVRMPGIGGPGFHRELHQRTPELLDRCLFFTGEMASPEIAAFAAKLAQPVLTKPFDFVDLFRRAAQIASPAA